MTIDDTSVFHNWEFLDQLNNCQLFKRSFCSMELVSYLTSLNMYKLLYHYLRDMHGSDGLLLASHCGDPGSVLWYSILDLWGQR